MVHRFGFIFDAHQDKITVQFFGPPFHNGRSPARNESHFISHAVRQAQGQPIMGIETFIGFSLRTDHKLSIGQCAVHIESNELDFFRTTHHTTP